MRNRLGYRFLSFKNISLKLKIKTLQCMSSIFCYLKNLFNTIVNTSVMPSTGRQTFDAEILKKSSVRLLPHQPTDGAVELS